MSDSSLPEVASVREPQLLRFRLRQMFLGVTLLSLLCALLVTTEGPWPLVIGVGTLLVGAHVVGNLIGTRLRDTSQQVRDWRSLQPGFVADDPLVTDPTDMDRLLLPPETPLAEFGESKRWIVWTAGAGAIVGAILGGTLLAVTIGWRIGWGGWTVGTISSAVLGTWAAFLASSFGSIARHTVRHAHKHGD